MLRSKLVMMIAAASVTTGFAGAGTADEFGTAAEARAMLERAIPAMKQDKAAANNSFNHNVTAFRDRDLFVFCFNGKDGNTLPMKP